MLRPCPVSWWRRPDAWGARRKFLARGEGGFFSQYSEFPPGYAVPLHRHDHDEMIVLLDGSCTMSDGRALGTHDSVVLTAGFEYGFTAGEDGMVFLTIRAGRADHDPDVTEERVRSARARSGGRRRPRPHHLEQTVDGAGRAARTSPCREPAARARVPPRTGVRALGRAQARRGQAHQHLPAVGGSALRSTRPPRSTRSRIWVMPPLDRTTISVSSVGDMRCGSRRARSTRSTE